MLCGCNNNLQTSTMYIYNFMLQVPLFASVGDAFLRHLTLKIRPSMFLPGEFIVHKGDVGLGMFFLYHGTVCKAHDNLDPMHYQRVDLHMSPSHTESITVLEYRASIEF